MILDYLNEISREILEGWRESDREAEALWASHLADLNPTFKQDVHKRQMVGVAWEIAACVAFLAFVGWLATY